MTCDAHIDTGAHIDTISHDPSPSSSLPSHLYSPMCYLLLVFALGGAAEQPRCDACDKVDCPGAVGGACPHFRDARGRPLPRVQPHPSAEQLTADKNDSSREPIIAKGVVVPMDGEKLRCFYNSIVAGLRHCGHVCAAELSTVPSLRRCLADFLSGPLAPLIRINNAETLAEGALRDGTSMDQMATGIQCDGAHAESFSAGKRAGTFGTITWQSIALLQRSLRRRHQRRRNQQKGPQRRLLMPASQRMPGLRGRPSANSPRVAEVHRLARTARSVALAMQRRVPRRMGWPLRGPKKQRRNRSRRSRLHKGERKSTKMLRRAKVVDGRTSVDQELYLCDVDQTSDVNIECEYRIQLYVL